MAGARGGGYRAAMWLCFAVGLLNLWTAVRSARSGRGSAGGTALLLFFVCLAAGAFFGWRRAQLIRGAQETQSRGDAILLLVAELGRHDDATLDRIARQGGPAGEAAAMVIQGRRERGSKN